MERKFKARAEAIEDAITKLDVGDCLYIHSSNGRTEYCLKLVMKEECREQVQENG